MFSGDLCVSNRDFITKFFVINANELKSVCYYRVCSEIIAVKGVALFVLYTLSGMFRSEDEKCSMSRKIDGNGETIGRCCDAKI